jgi:thiol-disulfide isomerase/thioredoxin
MKMKLFILLILLSGLSQLKAQTGLTVAQDFTAKDVYGTSHNLFSYLDEGKIVLISFFTTTCGSCNIYTPEIVESFNDFGCNQGNVFYLGLNWGANNIGVIDFMAVHAVEFPCASGIEGLGNQINLQYEIGSHITALVVLPDRTIAAQFFGPNAYPTVDTLNSLLTSVGGHAQPCSVQVNEMNEDTDNEYFQCFPNPVIDELSLQINSGEFTEIEVEILNLAGQKILSFNPTFTSPNTEIKLDVTRLTKGVYFVRLKNRSQMVATQKLIKI